MAKKFLYRGKSIEELQAMSFDEFVAILPSNMKRTMTRMGLQLKSSLAKVREAKANNKPVKTHVRQLVVLPEMVGMTIGVYDGKTFNPVKIIPEMLGHRLGGRE